MSWAVEVSSAKSWQPFFLSKAEIVFFPSFNGRNFHVKIKITKFPHEYKETDNVNFRMKNLSGGYLKENEERALFLKYGDRYLTERKHVGYILETSILG